MQPTDLGLIAGVPFLGLLLSIALLPALAPRFWLRRMGWVAAGWSLLLLAPLAVLEGPGAAWAMGWHVVLVEYLPFIALLGALYTAAGGVLLRGGPGGSPSGNTALLTLGMILGLVMGPTGAAMVMIQPLLHANAHRRRKVHLVLFLIVLVANASGALTPLGNPPLFVGLLRGVPFFWPAQQLWMPYLVFGLIVLAVFFMLDRYFAAREPPAPPPRPLHIRGWGNGVLVAVLGGSVLAQGLPLPELTLLGQHVGSGRLGGIVVAVGAMALSLRITPRAVRQANDFAWHPMIEVAILFAAIFVTLAPVSELLRTGSDGPLAPLFALTRDWSAPHLGVFWRSGILSPLLDNAPT